MLQIIPRAVKQFRISPCSFSLTKPFCDDKKNAEKSEGDPSKPKEDGKKTANDSLNKLLASMNKKHEGGLKKIELQKPGAARKQKKIQEKKQYEGSSSSDDEKKPKTMQEAVKNVTSAIGANQPAKSKEIESELLKKLLNIGDGSSGSLADLISNMQVDREDKKPMGSFVRRQAAGEDVEMSRAERVRRTLDGGRARFNDKARGFRDNQRSGDFQRPPREQLRVLQTNISGKSVNLFDSEPLGIFKNIEQFKDADLLPTWNELSQRELKQTVTHPPSNYFEKMILWTEQGKLWKFPIDNEQGRDDEANTYFTEHIFLEQHLESWCPSKGPIRHFMELVCVGLSKNYHITAMEKREHINWFKEYFAQKKEILESVILDNSKSVAAPKPEAQI